MVELSIRSIKPFNLFHILRRKLCQHVAVSCINFSKRHGAFIGDANVGFIAPAAFLLLWKIDNADAYAGEWYGRNVVGVPVTVAETPIPGNLLQAIPQSIGRGIFAD